MRVEDSGLNLFSFLLSFLFLFFRLKVKISIISYITITNYYITIYYTESYRRF